MSDTDWLTKQKTGQSPPTPSLGPAAPPAARKPSTTWVAVGAVLLVVGWYFYSGTQRRDEQIHAAQAAAQRATVVPRVRTAAEIQDSEAKNRAFAKQLDDDAYRKEISSDILKLNSIATRFQDINQVAAVSARIALAGPVQQMQAIRREVQSLQTHPCLAPATTALTGLISETTAAYLSFMASSTEAETTQHLDNVKAYVPDYTKKRDACVNW